MDGCRSSLCAVGGRDRDGIPDLVFIKTNNTPTGYGEVHIASGKSVE